MKIVAFGGKGMVGSRVVELLTDGFEFIVPAKEEVDITDATKLKNFLSKEKPQVVINFAAITDVNVCETERENKNGPVWKVNAIAPKEIASLSRELGFFFIQISTDMVFPGSKENPGPYEETRATGGTRELTWYGASKLEGEKGVMAGNRQSAVVRIIYPVRANYPQKLDYARKILSLYDEGKLYPMFGDQYVSITYIDELAEAMRLILEKKPDGVFHVSSSNTTTPFEFASYLLERVRNVHDVVKKSSFNEFIIGKDKRRYPQFGGLNCEGTEIKLGMKFSTWKEIVDKFASYL